MHRNAPFRLILSTRSQSDGFMRIASPSRVTPALFTNTSIRVLSRRVFAKPSFTLSADVTSRFRVDASPEHARISSATCSLRSISGEATTISKLARHSVSAMERPIPRLAPVTKATRLNIPSPEDVLVLNSRYHTDVTMAYQDLRDFIRALEKNQELKRIPFEVDPILEITEFADRAVKSGGPALLFERPKGFTVPVLINSFASMQKMQIALEVDSVDDVARRISEYLEMRMPEGLIGKLKMLPKLAEMGAFFPKNVSKAACQEIICTDRFSLLDYPILQCWPDDAGRFITLPLVFTRN